MFNMNYTLWWLFIATEQLVSESRYTGVTDICQKIWDVDRNRVAMGQHYRVNVQGHISNAKKSVDKAVYPLLPHVDENIFNKPTYKAFLSLLDNYNRFVGSTEVITANKTKESWKFIKAIADTGPIRELHKYLVKKRVAPTSMRKFMNKLFKIWFHGYRRRRHLDSSGFEHVFVGEIWRGKVTGFHNWLQFYRLEKAKRIDYRGYFRYHARKPVHLGLQFYWGKYKKRISSVFLGTSPEFEVALYTLCFMYRPGRSCRCRINGKRIPIVAYKDSRSGLIRSAYPVI